MMRRTTRAFIPRDPILVEWARSLLSTPGMTSRRPFIMPS
jgi:hypothetical protein